MELGFFVVFNTCCSLKYSIGGSDFFSIAKNRVFRLFQNMELHMLTFIILNILL